MSLTAPKVRLPAAAVAKTHRQQVQRPWCLTRPHCGVHKDLRWLGVKKLDVQPRAGGFHAQFAGHPCSNTISDHAEVLCNLVQSVHGAHHPDASQRLCERCRSLAAPGLSQLGVAKALRLQLPIRRAHRPVSGSGRRESARHCPAACTCACHFVRDTQMPRECFDLRARSLQQRRCSDLKRPQHMSTEGTEQRTARAQRPLLLPSPCVPWLCVASVCQMPQLPT